MHRQRHSAVLGTGPGAWRTWITIVTLITGCAGGGGGGGGTLPGGESSGSVSGLAAVTGSNLTTLTAPGATGTLLSARSLAMVDGGTVRALDLDGREVGRGTTDGSGRFTIRDMPLDRTLVLILEIGGKTLLTFVRIPRDTRTVAEARIDPLSALIYHRIRKIFADRGIEPGNLTSLEPAAVLEQIREVLEQLREVYDTTITVTLDQLGRTDSENADLFDELVPETLLDASGNPVAMAEAAADVEVGREEDLQVAIARRLYHIGFPLLFGMTAESTPAPLRDWVLSLPAEARLDGSRRDGTPWPGSGPSLVMRPFREPDRNGPGETPAEGRDEGPDRGGPFFNDAHLQQIVQSFRNGRRYGLAELHRIFFRPATAGGAGFFMMGESRFGDRHRPYVLTGEHRASVLGVDPQTRQPDLGSVQPIEPPLEYTFGELAGPVPNIQRLRQEIFGRRIHVEFNPTGAPREFVACKDNRFRESGGQEVHPIRVDIELRRNEAGKMSGGTVTESDTGAWYMGFTPHSEGDRAQFRFLRVDDGRELRTEFGEPLLGTRGSFADPARGALDIEAIFTRYAATESFVFGGPPVRLAGHDIPVVYDGREAARPVQVMGPTRSVSGSWDFSEGFRPAGADAGDGRRFLIVFTENTVPFSESTSEVGLVDSGSGEPVLDFQRRLIRIRLARIEGDLRASFHAMFTRLHGGEVPNPRHDPGLDPFFDDLDGNGEQGASEPTFAWRPFVPPEIIENFDRAAGEPGYLAGEAAYRVDPAIYSRPDGSPFGFDTLPAGFDFARSPRDNGLRLRRFVPRANGFFYRKPMNLLNILLAAFPPSFFDGRHVIDDATTFDFFQSLALVQYRFETPLVVHDIDLDLDEGSDSRPVRVPALGFRYAPRPEDPGNLMNRVMAAFADVPR